MINPFHILYRKRLGFKKKGPVKRRSYPTHEARETALIKAKKQYPDHVFQRRDDEVHKDGF